KNDFSVVISDQQRQAVLRGIFQNYYGGFRTDVVFDTGRMWCSKLPLLAALFPNSKVIACVRELPWVLDSVERLVPKQPMTVNKIFQFNPNGTVYSRTEALIDANGMVGFSFQAIKDAWYGQYSPGRMLLLTYEGLTRAWAFPACTRCSRGCRRRSAKRCCRPTCSTASSTIRSGWIRRTIYARFRWCRSDGLPACGGEPNECYGHVGLRRAQHQPTPIATIATT